MPHSPDAVLSILTKGGITAFFGVPDSTLNGFGHLILQPQKEVVGAVCSSEGSAVAEAIGHFLASGQPACVYMQNSGLSNALNPLSSLAHHDVFGIPVLLLVGWRGFPGTPDEPQHLVMGKSTIESLKSVGGQNPIEAAKMGCFIFHGPFVSNFKEIYEYFKKKGFSEEIRSPEELAKKLINNFNNIEKVLDKTKIEELQIYSESILQKVINEYDILINENFKT